MLAALALALVVTALSSPASAGPTAAANEASCLPIPIDPSTVVVDPETARTLCTVWDAIMGPVVLECPIQPLAVAVTCLVSDLPEPCERQSDACQKVSCIQNGGYVWTCIQVAVCQPIGTCIPVLNCPVSDPTVTFTPPPIITGYSTVHAAGVVTGMCGDLVATPFVPAMATLGGLGNPVDVQYTEAECIDGRTAPGGFYYTFTGTVTLVDTTYVGMIDTIIFTQETFSFNGASAPLSGSSAAEYATMETCNVALGAAKLAAEEAAYEVLAPDLGRAKVKGQLGILQKPGGYTLFAQGSGFGSIAYSPSTGAATNLLGIDASQWTFSAEWVAVSALCGVSTTCFEGIVLETGSSNFLLKTIS